MDSFQAGNTDRICTDMSSPMCSMTRSPISCPGCSRIRKMWAQNAGAKSQSDLFGQNVCGTPWPEAMQLQMFLPSAAFP